MNQYQPHISIIILNWNGARDTIECLETVFKMDYSNYDVVLIDNGSNDDSVEEIITWAAEGKDEISTRFPELVYPPVQKPLRIYEFEIGKDDDLAEILKTQPGKHLSPKSIVLVRNSENSGFAAGNNLGIKVATTMFQSDYLFILNNDTVIEKDAIPKMVDKLERDRSVGAMTAAIYFYSTPGAIANEGGKITIFARRMYYSRPGGTEFRKVTFVTGCALLVRREVFDRVGLLSDRFFFGEEDFEFSWRLRKNHIPILCSTASRVYHKIGVSADKFIEDDVHRRFLYVFSRIIDMKFHMARPCWWLWRFSLLGYSIVWLTLKYNVRFFTAILFAKEMRRYTNIYSDARRATIKTIRNEISRFLKPR